MSQYTSHSDASKPNVHHLDACALGWTVLSSYACTRSHNIAAQVAADVTRRLFAIKAADCFCAVPHVVLQVWKVWYNPLDTCCCLVGGPASGHGALCMQRWVWPCCFPGHNMQHLCLHHHCCQRRTSALHSTPVRDFAIPCRAPSQGQTRLLHHHMPSVHWATSCT